MNKYTQQFHAAEFDGYQLDGQLDVQHNFWTNCVVPWAELQLDINTESTYNWLSKHDHLFQEVPYQVAHRARVHKKHQDWYTPEHANGWSALYVLGEPPVFKELIGSQAIPKITPELHSEAAVDLLQQIQDRDIVVTKLEILKLDPGGWIQPHQDKKYNSSVTMNRVWMPLHNFAPCLKIYPSGYVPHNLGQGYVLNNENFMHSVINQESKSRYVAIWSFDHTVLPKIYQENLFQDTRQRWYRL
jgi:hypothetical protein